jgi:iron complex transport system substrate-binding protein
MPRRCLLLVLSIALACRETPRAATTDGLGRSVVLPARIERVVTLAPNLTEMIFAVGAGAKIVGTDDYSNYPAAARALPKVGGMQPNVEKIAALKPDLVLASSEGNHPSLAPALAAAGIPLYVVRTDRLQEVAPAMKLVGDMLDAPRTDAAVRKLDRDIAAQHRMRTNAPRVMFAVWVDPLYVGGRETFTDDLLVLSGAQNAVEVTGWPQYSLESLLASPPDLILYPRGAVTPQQIAALQKRVPELHAHIVPVDEDIFQRPGPRVTQAAHSLNVILDQWNVENDER